MSDDSISTYCNYKIVARVYKDVPQAVAWYNGPPDIKALFPWPVRDVGLDVAEAREKVKSKIDQIERQVKGVLFATLQSRHDQYLREQHQPFVGRGMRSKAGVRIAHCIDLHHPIDSSSMPECSGCGATICLYCARCGCGSGAWQNPYAYSEEKAALLDTFRSIAS